MTIRYNGFESAKGSTRIHLFWTDMHILTFRSDMIINSHADLKDVCQRFEAENAAFDITNYDVGSKFIKANRQYDVLVTRETTLHVIRFTYQDKEYRLRTRNFFIASKARKLADTVHEDFTEFVECLVSDATGEIHGEATKR